MSEFTAELTVPNAQYWWEKGYAKGKAEQAAALKAKDEEISRLQEIVRLMETPGEVVRLMEERDSLRQRVAELEAGESEKLLAILRSSTYTTIETIRESECAGDYRLVEMLIGGKVYIGHKKTLDEAIRDAVKEGR